MKKLIVIILVLIGFSSFGQTYLVQPAKWRFTNSQRFDSTVRFYNLPILTGDTVIGFNPYSKKIGLKIIPTNYWSTSGNTFSNGQYLGTNNNRGFPIVINGKKQVYFDTLAGVNLYDRNASRILSIYKNNSATSRTGTVYNSRPDSTNSSKSGHIFIADGANISPSEGTYYSTVAIQQSSLSTSGTGIAASLLVQPKTILQSSGSGYISGITINSGNTIGGGALYFRGLDIPNCGNNSNSYGIHQADAVGRNYFAAATQFGSTTTSTSAQVQINSTTKGFLPPVMTNAQKRAISSPATGLVVYDNGTNKLNYYNGSSWRGLDSSSGGSSGWGLTGNSVTNSDYFGSTNNRSIPFFTNGTLAMTLDSNKRLGLGLRLPTVKFHIAVPNAQDVIKITKADDIYTYMKLSLLGGATALYFGNGDGEVAQLSSYGNQMLITQNIHISSAGYSTVNRGSKLTISQAPTASANYGLTSRGSGAFDGSTSGFYAANANGQVDAINLASGSTADFANWQLAGAARFKFDNAGTMTAIKYQVSALNTAPSSASDTGTTGEIRVTATYIYVCTATNTWVRTALATW